MSRKCKGDLTRRDIPDFHGFVGLAAGEFSSVWTPRQRIYASSAVLKGTDNLP